MTTDRPPETASTPRRRAAWAGWLCRLIAIAALPACTVHAGSWSRTLGMGGPEPTTEPVETAAAPTPELATPLVARRTAAASAPREDLAAPPRRAPDTTPAAEAPSPEPVAPAAHEPTSVSIAIRSSCGQTVKVRFGDTTGSMSSNEVESRSLDIGDAVWLLDESGHPVASAGIDASTREVTIGSDCASVHAR